MIRPLIAGNWKMNGLEAWLEVIEAIGDGLNKQPDAADCLICPPFTMIAAAAKAADKTRLNIGAQDCHTVANGAHTGDISAEMIADAGGKYVIVGHSERRADHGESDATIAAKVEAAFRAGLTPIICVGETLSERESGETIAVISSQLAGSIPASAFGQHFVVAYEPVWAIGTGKVASVEQVEEVHDKIREILGERFPGQANETPILYGGSMKPSNAPELLAVGNVNGGLIGGASLKADDFLSIYAASVS
ncbi:triose-phosphate isomerase [Henriciella litoralis]|uniref:triose-phosphate isomerase n=1 Tax=Henriciella litoralis TaxID=568102 RepID=UPI000A034A44|nr:triose-phosphate isomerase [Henriciella litoralis]